MSPSSVGRPPFVGRETQLGALMSAVNAAELGENVLVLIAGEPGIGKTRLVAELAARVSARVSARTVWATCWEGDGVPAYWPWRQLVRAVSEVDEPAMAVRCHEDAGSGGRRTVAAVHDRKCLSSRTLVPVTTRGRWPHSLGGAV